MRKIIPIIFFSLLSFTVYSQAEKPDNEINLDLLKAPTSPAFNMLDISPSLIEKPTDLTSFLVSIQNASGNFTSFPKNYAVEIAPFLLFKKTGHTLGMFDSTGFKYVFPQTFQLSLGVSRQNKEDKVSDDSSSFTKAALGIKFSIIRRKWSDETSKIFNDLKTAQKALLKEFDNPDISPEIADLNKEADSIRDRMIDVASKMPSGDEKDKLITELRDKLREINKEKNDLHNGELLKKSEAYKRVKKIASEFKVDRKKGGYLDFASGMVLDFPGDRINSSAVSKAGMWLTGGYDTDNDGFSVMGIIRYLYQPDKILADDNGLLQTKNISTLDMGSKLSLAAAKGRFNFSSEAIYRSVLQKNIIDPSWRLVLNMEYDIGKNQKLTFVFGKNFDGTITKGGNLLAALNFIKGFGSSKKITD